MLTDGYLRMNATTLGRTALRHLHSGIDESALTSHRSLDGVSVTAGYTEWQARRRPALSVGWDWIRSTAGLELIAGSVRSNLMLVDSAGADLGAQATERLLGAWLHDWDWQGKVLQTLRLR